MNRFGNTNKMQNKGCSDSVRRRLEPYSVPAETQALVKKRKQFEALDVTREIFRCIFPLCKSGSKQIIIGLDSCYEFFPTVTIAKTGRPGVKLPHYAFKTLCDSLEYISEYFSGHHDGTTVVNLAPEIIVEFGNQYGKRVITFCSDVQTNNEQRVTIVGATWAHFRKMLDLIYYLFNQQESWTLDAQILFAVLREHCKLYFPGHAEKHTDMNQLEKFMKDLTLGDIDYTPRQECRMDVERAFLEMKNFCSFDTMGNI
jgi:hypothetical protein